MNGGRKLAMMERFRGLTDRNAAATSRALPELFANGRGANGLKKTEVENSL